MIHDKETGEKFEERVEVNHPVSYKGVQIYQSSFDDGGSTIYANALPMGALTKPFKIEGTIGSGVPLARDNERLSLELTGLRVINVENMAGAKMGADVHHHAGRPSPEEMFVDEVCLRERPLLPH